MVAFVAKCGEDEGLWIRSLVTGEVRELAGTVGAYYPFWSPDSHSLGFFANSKLKRIDLQSGAVRDMAPVVSGRGGSWSTGGVILYAPDISGPLYRMPAAGGTPVPATAVSKDSNEITHRIPYFLPDGNSFLYAQGSVDGPQATLRSGRLGSTDSHEVLDFASNVAYAEGRLLFVHDGLLMAQGFDAGKAKLTGNPVSLIPGLETWAFRYLGNFSISSSKDLLVYQPYTASTTRAVWFDPRSGNVSPVLDAGQYRQVEVSPDGHRLLVERGERDNPFFDLWLYDLANQSWTRVTSRPEVYYDFVWSPDGTRIGYNGSRDSSAQIVALDHSSAVTLPLKGENLQPMEGWSPDGSFLLGWQQVGTTGFDIVITPLTGEPESRVLYSSPADDNSPRLSADGRLLAFISNESGRTEVYVTRMPDAKAHWQVSVNGVQHSTDFRRSLAWDRHGRQLYFVDGSKQLVSVTVGDESGTHAGQLTRYPAAPKNIIALDTAPDGRLLLVCDESPSQAPLALVEHWPALLSAGP
jgi:Tol biopolymer transport system component